MSSNLITPTRREFLRSVGALAGTFYLAGFSKTLGLATALAEGDQYDVVVAGAGPAGLAAAISAARSGCSVLLVEESDLLGGVGTQSEITRHMTGYGDVLFQPDFSGLYGELRDRLASYYAGHPERTAIFSHDALMAADAYEPHIRNNTLHAWLESIPGCVLLKNHAVVGVTKDGSRVSGVTLRGPDGQDKPVSALVTVDCTGDADVADLAGCAWRMGREAKAEFQELLAPDQADEAVQGMTCSYTIRDTKRRREPLRPAHYATSVGRRFGGIKRTPLLRYRTAGPGSGKRIINSHHVYGDPLQNLAALTSHGRRQAADLLYYIQHHLGLATWDVASHFGRAGGWPAVIGVRESRRIEGEYMIRESDVLQAKAFEDGICDVYFGISAHPCRPAERAIRVVTGAPFQIPYRALVPQSIDGLLVAGRCISASHVAQSAIRSQPTCMLTGQAAGTAAALAVRSLGRVRDVDPVALRRSLVEQGVNLGYRPAGSPSGYRLLRGPRASEL